MFWMTTYFECDSRSRNESELEDVAAGIPVLETNHRRDVRWQATELPRNIGSQKNMALRLYCAIITCSFEDLLLDLIAARSLREWSCKSSQYTIRWAAFYPRLLLWQPLTTVHQGRYWFNIKMMHYLPHLNSISWLET